MSNDDHINELFALAALGELTDADQRELDAVLENDPERRDELQAMLDAAARIQRSGAEAPPADLKARVLTAIEDVEQRASNRPLTKPVGGDSTVTAIRRPRGRARRHWITLAAAAALIGFVVGALVVPITGDETPSAVEAVTQADDARSRTLSGELSGSLTVVYSPSEDAIVLVGTGIPGVAADQTYQLWLVDDDGAQPVGLFQPNDSGRVTQRYEGVDPSDLVVGVTIEPAGGSETPTLPIVAAA